MLAPGHSAELRRCLEQCDIAGARALWAHVAPNLPQPADDIVTLATIHHARTQAEYIRFRLRAYSHAWLVERALPSALPDELRPRAQRMYPVIKDAVGIAVGRPNSRHRERNRAIERAMGEAVLECYAENKKDPAHIYARLREVREKVFRYE